MHVVIERWGPPSPKRWGPIQKDVAIGPLTPAYFYRSLYERKCQIYNNSLGLYKSPHILFPFCMLPQILPKSWVFSRVYTFFCTFSQFYLLRFLCKMTPYKQSLDLPLRWCKIARSWVSISSANVSVFHIKPGVSVVRPSCWVSVFDTPCNEITTNKEQYPASCKVCVARKCVVEYAMLYM